MTRPDVPKLSEAFKKRGAFKNLVAACPHCGTNSIFEEAAISGHHFDIPALAAGLTPGGVQTGLCRGCRGIVFGVVAQQRLAKGQHEHVGVLLWPIESWPDRAPADLESEIRSAYDQARAILPLSAMGAAVLARRCLQHLIRQRLGVTKTRLFDEITEAEKRDELSKPTRDALHHVRQIGNWGAHPSVDQAHTIIDVTSEEAEYTLETVEMVFQDLYVAPARIEAMSERLKARSENASAETDE